MYIDYYTLLSYRTLHYKEKTSEKLLQQVAIKKWNWHHFCIIILTELI